MSDKENARAPETDAEIIRRWLESVMEETGLKPTPLAKRVGVAPSTVIRALDPESKGTLERSTISKITHAINVPGPPLPGAGVAPDYMLDDLGGGRWRSRRRLKSVSYAGGHSRPDMIPLNEPIPELTPETPTQIVWRILTRACELAGYLPGDLALLDQAATPLAGDLVCAEIYDFERGGVAIAARIFDPPYIVTATMDPSLRAKPHAVDNTTVKIIATAVRMVRRRSTP